MSVSNGTSKRYRDDGFERATEMMEEKLDNTERLLRIVRD